MTPRDSLIANCIISLITTNNSLISICYISLINANESLITSEIYPFKNLTYIHFEVIINVVKRVVRRSAVIRSPDEELCSKRRTCLSFVCKIVIKLMHVKAFLLSLC